MLQLALLLGILVTGRVQCVRPSSLRPVLEAALQVPLPEEGLHFDSRLHILHVRLIIQWLIIYLDCSFNRSNQDRDMRRESCLQASS